MANSGIFWIDWLFDAAIHALFFVAGILGITYEEINVYLFCIMWPVSQVMLVVFAMLWLKERQKAGTISAHKAELS